jgi:hypothetical protein
MGKGIFEFLVFGIAALALVQGEKVFLPSNV